MEPLELRNRRIVDHRHAAAVKAPGRMPVVAVADVAIDAVCKRMLLDCCHPAAGVVAPCRVGARAGGSSAFAKVAHTRSSPALLSAAASDVPQDLTCKQQQMLDACGDAVMVPALDSVPDVLRASGTASAQMPCN